MFIRIAFNTILRICNIKEINIVRIYMIKVLRF